MASVIIKAALSITIVTLLFTLLPFQIALPQELVTFFTNGAFHDFINILYYFFPIDFLIACLIFLYSAKYLGIFMNIISWIYHKLVG